MWCVLGCVCVCVVSAWVYQDILYKPLSMLVCEGDADMSGISYTLWEWVQQKPYDWKAKEVCVKIQSEGGRSLARGTGPS